MLDVPYTEDDGVFLAGYNTARPDEPFTLIDKAALYTELSYTAVGVCVAQHVWTVRPSSAADTTLLLDRIRIRDAAEWQDEAFCRRAVAHDWWNLQHVDPARWSLDLMHAAQKTDSTGMFGLAIGQILVLTLQAMQRE